MNTREARKRLRHLDPIGQAGRPFKPLDVRQIEELASIQCTNKEIASVMGCGLDGLVNNYANIIEIGRQRGKESLRRAQYRKAIEGNSALLIWLGKHYLDQKEEAPTFVNISPISDDLNKLRHDPRPMALPKELKEVIQRKAQEMQNQATIADADLQAS